MDGPGWSYQEGWLEIPTPCRWIGVVCHGGHGTELSLGFNNLNGVSPGAVGDLQYLTPLNLIYNQIRGFPSDLGRLTKLQSLFLPENNLASLPPEIGALVNLRELHLSGNPLTTLPPENGDLPELRELYLRIDSLWELPEELAALTNLRVLHVSSPLLSEGLPEMGNWTQLEVLATDVDVTLHFLLDTVEADMGDYTISTVVGVEGISARSTASLTLSHEDFRDNPPTANYPTVSLPSGLTNDQSVLRQIYLPTIVR